MHNISMVRFRYLYDLGWTDKQIARKMDVPTSVIWNFRRRHSIPVNKAAQFRRKFEAEYGYGSLKKLLELRQMGCSLAEIGEALGLTRQAVSLICAKVKQYDMEESILQLD